MAYHQRGKKVQGYYVTEHPLYSVYNGMKSRCYSVDNVSYKNYGGRGIAVCSRWLNSFEAFALDMGLKPSKDYSIDRIDNDADYNPTNCKWSTRTEQNRNKRVYKTSATGYSGIRLTKAGTYQVRKPNTRLLLGCYATLDDALYAQNNTIKQTAPRINNSTGVRGVTGVEGGYIVRKVIDGKRIYLGTTATLDEAKALYLIGVKQARKSKTRVTGISFNSKIKRYMVRKNIDGKRVYVGSCKTLDEAKRILNEN